MSELVDDYRVTTMGLLFEAHIGLVGKLEPTWKRAGLSGLDLNALLRLSRSPGRRLRMNDLATQIKLSTSGVTRLVDRLERGGLVVRESSRDDRRSTFAVLTPKGAERLDEVLPGYIAAIERWFISLLDPGQLEALTAGLRIIRDATNPEATARTPD